MTTRRNLFIAGIAVTVLLVLAAVAWFVVLPLGTFGDMKETVLVFNEPLSLAEARTRLSFPLPDGASDIQYGEYHCWLAFEMIVRFHAPVEVCKTHAAALIEHLNRSNPQNRLPAELSAISAPPLPIAPSSALNVTWFDVQNIRKGFESVGDSHIWIDAERGVFYYRMTD